MSDCGCNKPEKNTPDAGFTITNPSEYVLLRKTVAPSSLGDDTVVKPVVGKYCNTLVEYELNHHVYLYSSDGIPTRLDGGAVLDTLEERVKTLEAKVKELEGAE